jgi:hypothetical protein
VIDLNHPELSAHNERLRARERRIAAGALGSAFLMSIIRAFLLPWLIRISPPNTFPGMDPTTIGIVAMSTAALFGLLALWALRDPLSPCVAALVFYAAISVPDLIHQPGFLAKGIISKFVMCGILLRGLAAGLVHWTMRESTSS